MPTFGQRLRGAIDRNLAPWRERRALSLVQRLGDRASFDAWEQAGWHLTPVHYYSPIPDTRALPASHWETHSDLAGIDMREPEQVALARSFRAEFGDEYDRFTRSKQPSGFHLQNKYYEAVDAEVLHAMIRRHRPSRVVEIGSGWSTLVTLGALGANGHGSVEAFEPFPPSFLAQSTDARLHLTAVGVQQVPLETFTSLGAGDVLFIDSTHVGRIGSDVLYEILEVLPRLAPGVLVHVHDIFLPADYPREWVMHLHRFWNEQYLLQAFLAHNSAFEVVWASHTMHLRHPEVLRECFSSYDPATTRPGALWIRRV